MGLRELVALLPGAEVFATTESGSPGEIFLVTKKMEDPPVISWFIQLYSL